MEQDAGLLVPALHPGGMPAFAELLEVKTAEQQAKPPTPAQPPVPPAQPVPILVPDSAEVECTCIEQENERCMKAYVPWQQKDWIEKIMTIPGRAWKQEGIYWSVPMTKSVIRQLKEWFGEQVHFSFDLPAEMPEDYRPANWWQPQTGNEAPPTPPATHGISPEPVQILPARTLNQATNPPDSPAKPAEKQHQYEDRANQDVVKVFRMQEDKNTVFLQVPAHRRDWI